MSYKTKAAATADRACLARQPAALNAAHNAVRLNGCRLWTVRGSRGYVSTWRDGQTWMLAVGSKTPRHWTFATQRMASFPGLAQVTQDGDDEGVLRPMRLPTPPVAAEIGERPGSGSRRDRPLLEGVSTPPKRGIRPLPCVLASGPAPNTGDAAERIHDGDRVSL